MVAAAESATRRSSNQRSHVPRMPRLWGIRTFPALGALYALGIIRNHPFVDGNKRVATVLLETFLALHGYELEASDADLLATIVAVAASEMNDEVFTEWVRAHARAPNSSK